MQWSSSWKSTASFHSSDSLKRLSYLFIYFPQIHSLYGSCNLICPVKLHCSASPLLLHTWPLRLRFIIFFLFLSYPSTDSGSRLEFDLSDCSEQPCWIQLSAGIFVLVVFKATPSPHPYAKVFRSLWSSDLGYSWGARPDFTLLSPASTKSPSHRKKGTNMLPNPKNIPEYKMQLQSF